MGAHPRAPIPNVQGAVIMSLMEWWQRRRSPLRCLGCGGGLLPTDFHAGLWNCPRCGYEWEGDS